MKRRFSFLTVLTVLVLSLALLTGCESTDDDDASSSSSVSSSTSTSSGSSSDTKAGTDEEEDDTAAGVDVIGEVTAITASYITLDVYETDEDVEDYATLDTTMLTSSGTTDTVTIEDDAEYYYISAETLVTTTSDNIEAGDMIVVTVDESEVQQIILLEKADSAGDTSESDTSADDTSAEESDTAD